MFELKHIKGNTYYYEAFSNVGVYKLNDNEAVLIDACDHMRMAKGLNKLLREMGLRVKTIISTHCHVDHICGNSFFHEEYGCRILSTKMEQRFISYPDLEPKFYYSGIDTDKRRNPFFLVEPSESEIITPENTPEGLEIIELPGHSFEMIGVRTPDNVVFLADAVLSRATWDNYMMPFFYNVNLSIETMKKIKDMEADCFVPSHNPILTDIRELAQYNIDKMNEKKALILESVDGRSFDELFKIIIEKQNLRIKTEKYPMYALMLRNFLQSLVEDDKIYGVLEDNVFVYHRK
ncbi:MAG: MBL fold metallo-hydrolase [Clostridia bacterium]|nr:MBL fold metallo-hydrolase [Clostridia bacterium]